MIQGIVTDQGVPVVILHVAGQDWPATVDTGFNGDLELPEPLRPHVNPVPLGPVVFNLASGQQIEEETFEVDFPFDGQVVKAEATFVGDAQILIGTHLMRDHRLEVDFPGGTVLLERLP